MTHGNYLPGTIMIVIFLFISSAWAQERNNFVFGFGMGPGITSYTTASHGETNGTVGIGFKIGGEISQNGQLYFSSIISAFELGDYEEQFGLAGCIFRYFLTTTSPSLFVSGGGDIGLWREGGGDLNLHFSLGPRGGIGYEITPHVNVEGTISRIVPGETSLGVTSYWMLLNYEI